MDQILERGMHILHSVNQPIDPRTDDHVAEGATPDDAVADTSVEARDELAPDEVAGDEHVIQGPVAPTTVYARWGKRALDLTVGSVATIALSPLLLATAAVVRARLGSPIVFRQERIGRDGVPFVMLKFRTMDADRRAEELGFVGQDRRRRHKTTDDPRHTRVGRMLRRTSLDELPQLFHVLSGKLSLVGPRPELASVVANYEPWQHARHLVTPGLTGLWQVTHRNEEGEMHLHVDIDTAYVDSLSLGLDLRILGRTVGVLLGRPARPMRVRGRWYGATPDEATAPAASAPDGRVLTDPDRARGSRRHRPATHRARDRAGVPQADTDASSAPAPAAQADTPS